MHISNGRRLAISKQANPKSAPRTMCLCVCVCIESAFAFSYLAPIGVIIAFDAFSRAPAKHTSHTTIEW